MTIKTLKELIKDLPDEMDVFVDERCTSFKYGLVNSLAVKQISFFEDEGDEVPLCEDTVVVLSDE